MSTEFYNIFRSIHQNLDDKDLQALISTAVYQRRFIEWYDHHEASHNVAPNPNEINAWHNNQPPQMLDDCAEEASRIMATYAETVESEVLDEMEHSMQQQLDDLSRDVIVQKLDKIDNDVNTQFGFRQQILPQVGISTLGGLIGAIVFTVIVAAFTIYLSGQDWDRLLTPNTASTSEGTNG